MHVNERFEAYQVKKNLKKLEETLRKKFGVSERGLGDEQVRTDQEKSKNENRISKNEYIDPQ